MKSYKVIMNIAPQFSKKELNELTQEQINDYAMRYYVLRNGWIDVLTYKDHGNGPELNSGEELDKEIDALIGE